MFLGIVLLILGIICLVVFYNGVPENWLRLLGILLCIAGVVLILVPLLLDAGNDNHDTLGTVVTYLEMR